jgi:tetratricopeptide (TPR) repeat protein
MVAESRDIARKRLAQAEQAFRRGINLYSKDEYSYYSLAKLYLDWARKYADESPEYMAKCETVISDGLRVVAAKEGLWVVSAEVQDWIGNEPAKIQALEKAVSEHQSSVFPRYLLARAYRKAGEPKQSIEVLEPVLKDNPNEFRVCLEYARALEEIGEPRSKAIAVLGLGTLYGLGDPRFIATYAGMMFMNEQFTDAARVFADTSKKDFNTADANMIHYRPIATVSPRKHVELRGKVLNLKAGFAFVEVAGFPRFICPSSKQRGITLRNGMNIVFEPAFSAKGPIADKPRDSYTGPAHKRPV